MANPRLPLVTARDLEILAALDRCPLTAEQLLKVSATFELPFSCERTVRHRMFKLVASGRVRRWPYVAIAGRGMLTYYRLSPLGYQLLYPEGSSRSKYAFQPIGLARQHHTFSLAQFIVHTAVCAHRAGLTFTDFAAENTLLLSVHEEHLFPDCAFRLVTSDGKQYSFYVEIDNASERVRSEHDPDSWERKLKFYEAFQDQCQERFRVLVIPTRGSKRLDHILTLARILAKNPRRSLIYGLGLQSYCSEVQALSSPCFLNHRSQKVALLPLLPEADRPNAAPTTQALIPAAGFS